MGDFGDDVELWIKDAQYKSKEVIRKTALDLFSRVIRRTPADTGNHRGNWNASIGDPVETYDSGVADRSGAVAIKQASAALASIKGDPGDVDIYLSNAGPAINVLEYGGYPTTSDNTPSNGPKTINGYSRKAPRGMVRVSVEEFDQHFKKAAREEGFKDS